MTSTGPVPATTDVVVCLGPGGVGKTTTAAALGVAEARRGRHVVVLTIDPARRLLDALGLDGPADTPRPVDLGGADTPGSLHVADTPGSLHVAMLDPGATFDDVIRAHAASDAQVERILGNRIYRNLTAGLSGVSEYMASERLRELHADPRFDLVIIDTPPSRHAFDFLDGPGRLARFVDHRIYRSVLAPRRGVLRAVNATAQLVVRTIARVVGADLVDDAVGFFAAFEGMDTGFRERASEVEQLLAAPTTAFVLVGAARRAAIGELRWIADNLERRGLHASSLVMNRLTLPDPPDADTDPLPPAIAEAWEQLLSRAAAEAAVVDDVGEQLGIDEVHRVAELDRPVSDLPGMVAVADQLG